MKIILSALAALVSNSAIASETTEIQNSPFLFVMRLSIYCSIIYLTRRRVTKIFSNCKMSTEDKKRFIRIQVILVSFFALSELSIYVRFGGLL